MAGGGQPNARRAARPTSTDVAEAAGVSRATVSYVLNGVEARYRIAPATRDRVLATARKLGYEPNAAALALRAGRNDIVLVQMPEWPLGGPTAEAVISLSDELESLGYTPLIHFLGASHPTGLARACRRVQPVGLITTGNTLTPDLIEMVRSNGTRGLLAIDERPVENVSSLVIAQRDIGRVAGQHLAGRGYRKVLALHADEPGMRALSAGRTGGLIAVAMKRALSVQTISVRLDRTAVDDALAQARPGTAVFAFNDAYALLALELARGRGISIPSEMAIIGCDDSAEARRAHPPLTTVRLSAADLWRRAARTLHATVEGRQSAPVVLRARPAIVAGETT